MKHFIFVIGLLATFFLAPSAFSAGAKNADLAEGNMGPVSLRENIVVSDSYIRLGDLFVNVPMPKADTAVAYSPKPGRRASFDARWLYRVARAYKLKWRPLSAELRTLVTRDSIIINKEEIVDAITESLFDHNLPQNPQVELSNRNMRIHVPSNIMPEVSIEDVTFNPRSKRFAAIVTVGEKNMPAVHRVRVTGQVHEMIEVPTLARRLAKGDVIKANDISWIKLRSDRAQRDVIVDASDLVGMTPKRLLRTDTPIRTQDIQKPILVSKGSVVTILLKTAGMTLTAQGKALQNGADGETIRIKNSQSKRAIEAIVIGKSKVTVLVTGPRPAQLAFKN